MPSKQHVVRLTPAERTELRALIAAGSAPALTQTHARILLKCDAGVGGPRWSDVRIAEAVDVSAHRGAGAGALHQGRCRESAGTQAAGAGVPAQAG